MSGGDARVRVYTRPGCHLCEQAIAVVESVCAETGDTWESVDITGDATLEDRFHDEIPVTFVDGRQHDFWRVDPTRLRTALAAVDSSEKADGARRRWGWRRRG